MESSNRTIEFLSKNYHPFTHFTEDMLANMGSGLRIFEIKAGETLSLQACSPEDNLYIVEGSANISFSNHKEKNNYQSSDKKVIQFSHEQSPIEISTDVSTTICHADSTLLNDFISFQEISSSSRASNKDAFMERLMFLKSTRAFRLLPLNVVEEAAYRCREIKVDSDFVVIRQDMKADNFYIILEGEAEVWREEIEDDEPQMVALLGVGDAFGEEALITGGARNATVQMTTEGRLLELTETDFKELVSAPALRSVTPEVAKAMISNGAQIIDVRFEEEYQESFIPGSVLMPLPELRTHIAGLDKEKEYLILCAVGMRASAATLLLRQKKIKARFIEGGIKAWPYATTENLDIELIAFDFCPYAQRGVISLLQNNIPHKLTYLDPENLPDWFDEVSPFGKVPILRVDGRTTIFESTVINELIALISTTQMLAADPIERSLCRSWTEFGSTLLDQVTQILGVKSEEEFINKRAELHNNLALLEEQLEGRGPYFSGDKFSLIDSTYAPLFMRMQYLNKSIPLYDPKEFPLITSWSNVLLSLDSVQNSIPGSFEKIYQDFIQKRSNGGWVETKCIKN